MPTGGFILNEDKCGFKCKLGKSFLGVKESIKKAQDDTRRKKADRYGVSLADYDKAVAEARNKGKKVAYGKFLKDVEKQEYLVPKSGDSTGKSTIDQILDSFAGTQTKPKRRTTKRKTPKKPGKYVVRGGIAYPVTTNKTKKRRKQKSKSKRRSANENWLGDLGVNF